MSATTTVPERMTADAFIEWAINLPEREHYELHDGELFKKTAERAIHGDTKVQFVVGFASAIRNGNLPCQVFTSEMAVRINDTVVYEPDVMVRCGDRLDPDQLYVLDPMIIVEIHSPSTSRLDTGLKLEKYFSLPTLRHYLVVNATTRRIIHHSRSDEGPFLTTILGDGPFELNPPGITISDLFQPA